MVIIRAPCLFNIAWFFSAAKEEYLTKVHGNNPVQPHALCLGHVHNFRICIAKCLQGPVEPHERSHRLFDAVICILLVDILEPNTLAATSYKRKWKSWQCRTCNYSYRNALSQDTGTSIASPSDSISGPSWSASTLHTQEKTLWSHRPPSWASINRFSMPQFAWKKLISLVVWSEIVLWSPWTWKSRSCKEVRTSTSILRRATLPQQIPHFKHCMHVAFHNFKSHIYCRLGSACKAVKNPIPVNKFIIGEYFTWSTTSRSNCKPTWWANSFCMKNDKP